MRSKTNYAILMFLFFLLSAPCFAVEELSVVTEDWRPYNYSEGNEVKGISTDIVRKVLERARVPYTITVYPWSRAYKLAQTKPNVLIYTLIRISPRESLFKWIRPLGKGGVTSLYRLKRNTHINPKTIEDAKQLFILANENSMDHLWLADNGFRKLLTPPRVENCIRMFFRSGRADLLAFDKAVIQEEFDRFGFDPEDAVEVMPLFATPPYMALSLQSDDSLVEKLQNAYDELLKEGQIELVN